MTAENVPIAGPAAPAEPARPADEAPDTAVDRWSRPYAGWLVVARKEFTDHLLSVRFLILVAILALAAVVPVVFGAEHIKTLASNANFDAARRAGAVPALFLALFYVGSDPAATGGIALPGVLDFLRWFAPLLGIAFAFDAVNGERSEGTLPRLLSQPIHRDDVINGKFAAGLAIIALVLTFILALIAGIGIFRLGIVPQPSEVLRLLTWLLVTLVYVSLWLAFGMLLSVLIRRAATSALIGFGVWFGLTFIGQLVVSIAAGVIAPVTNALAATDPDQYLGNQNLQQMLFRVLPDTLYREASLVLLNPALTSTSTPATLSQYTQQQEQVIGTVLSFDQSFIAVWPQVVALVAITVACFAVAYVRFMRQEVRA